MRSKRLQELTRFDHWTHPNRWDEVLPFSHTRRLIHALEAEFNWDNSFLTMQVRRLFQANSESRDIDRFLSTCRFVDERGVEDSHSSIVRERIPIVQRKRSRACDYMNGHIAWCAYLDRCWANAGAASVRPPRWDPHTCTDRVDDEMALVALEGKP